MPYDTQEEKTDYSTPHDIFIRESKGVNYIKKDTCYRDKMRRSRNPQVLTVQNYTVLAYGLRLSDSELITHFPLPEGCIIDTFIREVMCVVQEYCSREPENKDGKPGETEIQRRITAIHESRALKRLEDWTEEDRISDEELRYRDIHGRILGAIYRSGYSVMAAGHQIVLSDTTLASVKELTDIIAYSLSKDHTQFTFSQLVGVIVELRQKAGMKKTKLENALVKKEGYTHLRSVENKIQKSCGLIVVDKIASSLKTTSRHIYELAEEIAERDTKEPEIPQDVCKIPQDVCEFPQDKSKNPHVINNIPQVDSKIPQDGSKNPQVEYTISLVECKNPQAKSRKPQAKSLIPHAKKPDKASIPTAILDFCFVPRTMTEIKNNLGYKDRKSIRKYITDLLASGDLERRIPDKPSSRYQEYKSVKKKKE